MACLDLQNNEHIHLNLRKKSEKEKEVVLER